MGIKDEKDIPKTCDPFILWEGIAGPHQTSLRTDNQRRRIALVNYVINIINVCISHEFYLILLCVKFYFQP